MLTGMPLEVHNIYLQNFYWAKIEYSTTEILTWTKVYILAIVVDKLHLQSKSSQGYSQDLRTWS